MQIQTGSFFSATKVIAELGINHQGDLDNARKLVNAAAESGCWGIKFQYRKKRVANDYDSKKEIGDELLEPNLALNYLSPSQILELTDFARSLSLSVGISFFVESDVADFGEFLFDFYKVPSAVMTNHKLIRLLAAKGRDVLVSTGMQTDEELHELRAEFSPLNNLVVMHCVSNYPTLAVNSQIGFLHQLQGRYGFRIGYSSHDALWETALWSLPFGIEYLERHITLSKSQIGLDHSSSSTPEEFHRLVSLTKDFCKALEGAEGPRKVNQGEKINLQNLGQGLYAKESLETGAYIEVNQFFEKPPLLGLSVAHLKSISNPRLTSPVKVGEPLLPSHFDEDFQLPKRSDTDWASSHNVGLPVRLHDFQEVSASFGLNFFEFHLSFGEVGKLFDFTNLRPGMRFSVHAPDYVSPNSLLDPFSESTWVRQESVKALEAVAEFAAVAAEKSRSLVPVVVSLSNDIIPIDRFYSETAQLFERLSSDQVTFSLQWLPPIAWYFGGSVVIHRVNSRRDIGHLLENGIPLTMDFSHLALGENANLYKSLDIVESLSENIVHIHLSGAEGIDGEGTEFDTSDPHQRQLVQAAFDLASSRDLGITLEVWQGHLNRFVGFGKGIRSLRELVNG